MITQPTVDRILSDYCIEGFCLCETNAHTGHTYVPDDLTRWSISDVLGLITTTETLWSLDVPRP